MDQIGIILDQATIQRALKGKPTYENLQFYSELGKELGLKPIFFHPKDVDLRTNTIDGYLWTGNKLTKAKSKIPPVTHNRLLSGDRSVNDVIRHLSQISKVYNGVIDRNKIKVQKQLWLNRYLRSFLPVTTSYTREALVSFLKKYPVIYVKPSIGSIGNGVLRIERSGNEWKLSSAEGNKIVSKHAMLKEVNAWVNGKRFLVQQGIILAKYRGQPFDIRVSVQKNGDLKWTVTGMVAKVANPENQLSNLAQGGEAVVLSHILKELFDPVKAQWIVNELADVGLEIAAQFEQFHPTLADVGLDMGIDENGKPYLIEVNVRDQRYSFFKAGDLETFKQTYWNPLAYGKSLLVKDKKGPTAHL